MDTVGAGDAFQAAFLTGLHEAGYLGERDPGHLRAPDARRLLAFACEAAALSCTRRGADFLHRSDLSGE